jgi:hypothetical protein
MGLKMPKHGIPILQPKPILSNSEVASNFTFKPQVNQVKDTGVKFFCLFNILGSKNYRTPRTNHTS